MKKGQGMPVNVIIIAAIALIVLIILVAVFTGQSGRFAKKVASCHGACVPASNCTAVAPEGTCEQKVINYNFEQINWWGASEEQVCCLLVK